MKRFVWLCFLVWTTAGFAQPPDTLWTRHLGGAPDEMINAFCSASDGGYVLAGHCGSNGDEMGPQNFFVCRTDSMGELLWMAEIGVTDSNEFANAVCVTTNGDVVIAGLNDDYPLGTGHGHIVRLSEDGTLLWDRTYGETTHPLNFCAIAELQNGDLITASTYYHDDAYPDAFLMRMTASGDTLWTRMFGDSTDERISDLAMTPDGDIILCGRSYQEPEEYNRVRLMRVDTDGNLIWMRSYWSGIQVLQFTGQDVTVMSNGDLGVSATCYSERMEIWLMRADAGGDSLWTRTFSFDEYTTESCDVIGTSDNCLAVTGMIGSYPAYHIVLMKVAENGDLAWQFLYDDDQYGMAITGVLAMPDHSFVMSGSSFNVSNQADALLIRTLPELMGAADPLILQPSSLVLSAFPNPFNPVTTLSFSLSQAQNVTLSVYDLMGRDVARLAEGRYDTGEHLVTFDGTELASGIYFAQFKAGNRMTTTKLMLLK